MLNSTQMPGSIADSVEFVKKLWGIPSAGALPGMLIPTLSIEEINKKITDLKAVESWLTINMNMLHGTIQALEVQSATIVNLQSIGAILNTQQTEAKAAMTGGASAFPFSFPGWPPAGAAAEAPAASASSPLSPFSFSRSSESPAPSFTSAPPETPRQPVAGAAHESASAVGAEQGPDAGAAPNPNAWWDLLQNQFKQVVGTALQPDALKVASAGFGGKSASGAVAKAAKTSSGTSSKVEAATKTTKSAKSPVAAKIRGVAGKA